MIPTLAQICSLPSPLEKDVEDYAAGQCRSLELWFTKLENYLQSHSADDFRRLLQEREMQAPVVAFQGGILASQAEKRREAWDLFARRLELCQQLGVTTVVVAGDVPLAMNQTTLDQATVERVHVSLAQLAQACEQAGVRAALEFQASSAYVNNLQTAAALIAELNSPALGICLDAFHFYCGPSKTEDLGYLTPHTLFHVQLCDLADIPREFAADGDRILPGDGDLPLATIVKYLQQIGYVGPVSVECANPHFWQVPPRQFGEIAMTALRKVLGQASMES